MIKGFHQELNERTFYLCKKMDGIQKFWWLGYNSYERLLEWDFKVLNQEEKLCPEVIDNPVYDGQSDDCLFNKLFHE